MQAKPARGGWGHQDNADNMPPYELPTNQTQSGIKSHSTKGGGIDNFNEIRFEDKIGEESLNVQAEKDMVTLVKHDRTATILRNDTLNITGDQFIKIHGNLSMIVEGVTEKDNPDKAKPVKSSLGVTGAHRIDASDTIDIQAPNVITLTCGGSSIKLTPNEITITAGGKAKVLMNSLLKATSSDNSSLQLDPNACMTASGKAKLLLDGHANLTSSKGDQVLLDGTVKIKSNASVSVDGKSINCTGTADVSVTVGGSSVKWIPASVDIAGTTVNVQGSTLVGVKGASITLG